MLSDKFCKEDETLVVSHKYTKCKQMKSLDIKAMFKIFGMKNILVEINNKLDTIEKSG